MRRGWPTAVCAAQDGRPLLPWASPLGLQPCPISSLFLSEVVVGGAVCKLEAEAQARAADVPPAVPWSPRPFGYAGPLLECYFGPEASEAPIYSQRVDGAPRTPGRPELLGSATLERSARRSSPTRLPPSIMCGLTATQLA